MEISHHQEESREGKECSLEDANDDGTIIPFFHPSILPSLLIINYNNLQLNLVKN